MTDFILIQGDEIRCPHCDCGMDIDEWNTEYGDPIIGEHKPTCICCDKQFTMNVRYVKAVITVEKQL